jgi:hypothetical protein
VQIRDLDQTAIGNPNHDLIRLALSLLQRPVDQIAGCCLSAPLAHAFFLSAVTPGFGAFADRSRARLSDQFPTAPFVASRRAPLPMGRCHPRAHGRPLGGGVPSLLPDSLSLMQRASKTKLDMMSGDTFDKSYVKGMIEDHKTDIKKGRASKRFCCGHLADT